jgi:hypothetical protein
MMVTTPTVTATAESPIRIAQTQRRRSSMMVRKGDLAGRGRCVNHASGARAGVLSDLPNRNGPR